MERGMCCATARRRSTATLAPRSTSRTLGAGRAAGGSGEKAPKSSSCAEACPLYGGSSVADGSSAADGSSVADGSPAAGGSSVAGGGA